MIEEHCFVCGRVFSGHSVPRWLIEQATLRVAGKVHASHQIAWRGPYYASIAVGTHTALEAQRMAFCYHPLRQSPDRPTQLAQDLFVLEEGEREERLKWWREGPMDLTEAQEDEVRHELRRLEIEFDRIIAALQQEGGEKQ